MQNILADITAQNWILALFIRDDGERFLLGTGAYEFKKSLQHFQPNTYANDVVELQGTDGQLLAGQVRRTASQPFDGYIADQTINQTETESRRRAFLMFFRKKHFYTVAYILPNGTAIQRRRGYITDAPAVAEMIQRWPEYHVALNFEDPNYYEYAEDEDGNPIYAHEVELAIAGASVGGLVWDEDGVVWDGGIDWRTLQTVQGSFINLDNALDIRAPLSSVELLGNTTQNTLSGKNLLGFPDKAQYTTNSLTISVVDGLITINGTASALTFFDPTTLFNFGTTTTNLTLNIIRVSGTWSAGVMGISSRDSSDTQIQYHQLAYNTANLSTTKEYTATTLGNIANIKFYINKDSVLSNYKFYVQVVKGSTSDSNYEPYCGGIPSPNPDYPQTVQTTTGEQVVKITGKNLCGYEPKSSVQQGLSSTYDATTGIVHITGTATQTYSNISASLPQHIEAGTYAWRSQLVAGSFNGNINLRTEASDSSTVNTVYAGIGTTHIETLAEAEQCRMYIGGAVIGTTYDFSVKFQLEKGSQATDFEPYQSQSYKANLGKNLSPNIGSYEFGANAGGSISSQTADTIIFTTSQNSQYSGVYWYKAQNKAICPEMFKDGYTFSCTASATATTEVWFGETSVDAQTIGTTPQRISVQTNSTWNALVCYNKSKNNATITLKDFQVELGSTASDYTPYFTPIELCKLGTYQDKIYKSGDDWYVHKEVGKYTFTGDESPTVSSTSTNTTKCLLNNCLPADEQSQPEATAIGASNYFEYRLNWSEDAEGIYSNNRAIVFRGAKTTIGTTQAAVKTWLASTTPTYYYALATPTDTQITNQTLIDQLDALASSTLFVGVNNIALVPSSGAQGELRIIYPTDYALTGGAIWAIGGSGGQNIITVDGVDSAFPVWEVVGPATNPILTNTTTGQSITWNGTVPNGQSLVVDMGEQTATMAGANVFQYIDGQWIRLDAGNNTLTYTATGATAPSILSWNGVVG